MNQTLTLPDVLTLEEAADYLRLSRAAVKRQASLAQIPGRQVEGHWRFLRSALDDWLRSRDSRTVLLHQAGAFADDETLPQIRRAAYAQRGRPEVGEGSRS